MRSKTPAEIMAEACLVWDERKETVTLAYGLNDPIAHGKAASKTAAEIWATRKNLIPRNDEVWRRAYGPYWTLRMVER